MEFSEYKSQLKGPLSEVKLKILSALFDEFDNGGEGWVSGDYLLDLTGQKYFDRRTRELRDELGVDLENRNRSGKHFYRLVSLSIKEANSRKYLTASQKKNLFEECNFRCQVCGKYAEPGVRGLQADHKIPLMRGGGNEVDNWQALCTDCNVSKRRACEGCKLECLQCPWAFPLANVAKFVVSVPESYREKLEKIIRENPDWLSNLVTNEISKFDL